MHCEKTKRAPKYLTVPKWVKDERRWRKNAEIDKTHEELKRQDKMAWKEIEFLDTTTKKGMISEINRLVDYAKAAQAEELNFRREKLKQLITSEEETYEREFQSWIKHKVEDDIKSREVRLQALRNERENQRATLAKEKRLQQLINNCPRLRKKLLDESKSCQLLQIEEKKQLNEMEKDYDKCWHEIGLKVNEQMAKREEDEAALAICRRKCMVEMLEQQIEHGKQKNNRKCEIEQDLIAIRINKEMMEKEKEKEQELRKKRREQGRQLKECAIEMDRAAKERHREEEEITRKEIEEIQRELQRENQLMIERKKIMHKETLQYKDYMNTIRNAYNSSEKYVDEQMEDFRKSEEAKAIEKRDAIKAQRKDIEMGVYREVYRQRMERKQREDTEAKQEFDMAVAARQKYAEEMRLEQEKDLHKRRSQLSYGKELLLQKDLYNAMQEERIRKDKEEYEKLSEQYNDCDNLKKQLETNEIEILPLHPNLRLIRSINSIHK